MIELKLNSKRDLPSQLTANLVGRQVDLQPRGHDGVHPYTALNSLWRRASKSALALAEQIRLMQAEVSIDANATVTIAPAAASLKALIYDATELFDFYHQGVAHVLECGRQKSEKKIIRDYQTGIKRLRDPVALMCNRMKHDYREIVSGWFISETTGRATFAGLLSSLIFESGFGVPSDGNV
jgi:hypothetical protein